MYKQIANLNGEIVGVKIEIDGFIYSVPFNVDNTDYQAYLEWLAEGNTPLPADE